MSPRPTSTWASCSTSPGFYRDMTGMAIWVKDADRAGRTGRLTPFSGNEFSIEKANGRIHGRFIVQTDTGEQKLLPEQVILFREIHPGDWWHGLGWVEVALRSLNLGQNVIAIARQLLKNAVWPSVVVLADPKWNPGDEEWDRYKDMLDSYAALDKKGKPLALTGGGTATVVSAKMAELVPTELLDRVEATVSACSGIPAVVLQYLVGLKNSPWSQMEEARRMCYEDVVDRLLWKRTEKILTRQLLRDVDDDPTHYIRFDRSRVAALRADDTKRAAVVASLADIWTIDQALTYIGQKPRGDDLGAEIISHARSQAAPAPLLPAPIDDQGDVTDEAQGKRRRLALVPRPPLKKDDMDRAVARIVFQMEADSQQDAWHAAVARQLEKDQRKIAELAEQLLTDEEGKSSWRKDAAPDPAKASLLVRRLIARLEAYHTTTARKEWRGTVDPLIRLTSRSAVRSVATQVGIGFDILAENLVGYTEKHAAHLVTLITRTTRDAIASSLATGLEKGESMYKLRKRVQESDAAFGKARAENIARTETTGVQNGAQHEALQGFAKRTGAKATKEWLSAGDGRVRDSHDEINGETRGIGERYSNGLMYPGEPAGDPAEVCNCRCTQVFSVQKEAAA